MVLGPAVARLWLGRTASPRRCALEGRGAPPGEWVGCSTDSGPRRSLTARERLSFGIPIDLNTATGADLSLVPGLSPALGAAIEADRAREGPFETVEALTRVRGIGAKRLEKARSYLQVAPK
jgi:competence protein ComEA